MAQYITGRMEILVNGILLLNKAGAKASGIGEAGKPPVRRKAVMADVGIAGYVDEIIPARLECTIVDSEVQKLGDLAAIVGTGTVIFKRPGGNGKAYELINATNLGDIGVTAGEGDTDLVFEGDRWEERNQ